MDMDENDASGTPRAFTKATCAVFVDVFYALGMSLLGSSRSGAKGAATYWPFRSTDLMLLGLDNFAETMQQWYRFIQDLVVANGLRICLSFVISGLIKYKFLDTTILHAARRLTNRTMLNISHLPCRPGAGFLGIL